MKQCMFCQIANRERPARIVFEDESALAFEDVRPQAPVHILVIPKRHIAGLDEAAAEDEALLGHVQRVAAQLAVERNIARSGYRTVLNVGPNAGQSIFHLHLHLMGGRPMRWPPG
jgi:histidine triad (HIT) family protein